jgi:hypothetical protein
MRIYEEIDQNSRAMNTIIELTTTEIREIIRGEDATQPHHGSTDSLFKDSKDYYTQLKVRNIGNKDHCSNFYFRLGEINPHGQKNVEEIGYHDDVLDSLQEFVRLFESISVAKSSKNPSEEYKEALKSHEIQKAINAYYHYSKYR